MELDESRDDDAEYVIRCGEHQEMFVKFDTVEWAGGSWKLLKDGIEVGGVLDGSVEGLREVYDE